MRVMVHHTLEQRTPPPGHVILWWAGDRFYEGELYIKEEFALWLEHNRLAKKNITVYHTSLHGGIPPGSYRLECGVNLGRMYALYIESKMRGKRGRTD